MLVGVRVLLCHELPIESSKHAARSSLLTNADMLVTTNPAVYTHPYSHTRRSVPQRVDKRIACDPTGPKQS